MTSDQDRIWLQYLQSGSFWKTHNVGMPDEIFRDHSGRTVFERYGKRWFWRNDGGVVSENIHKMIELAKL